MSPVELALSRAARAAIALLRVYQDAASRRISPPRFYPS